MKLSFLLVPLLFTLTACADTQPDLKKDSQTFQLSSWRDADGYAAKSEAQLNGILTRDFPVGTSRAEVEEYLLASGDINIRDVAHPADSAGYSVRYYAKSTSGFVFSCGSDIDAVYNDNDQLVTPPRYRDHGNDPNCMGQVGEL